MLNAGVAWTNNSPPDRQWTISIYCPLPLSLCPHKNQYSIVSLLLVSSTCTTSVNVIIHNLPIAMSDLIVDFPQRRCHAGKIAKMEGVHFAKEYEIRFFERHDKADCEAMRIAARRAAQDVQKRVLKLRSSSGSDSADVADELDSCTLVGIENMLSPNIIKKTRASIMQCRRAVLDEQARQDESNHEYDPDRLASVAQHHTQWATTRGHNNGLSNPDAGLKILDLE